MALVQTDHDSGTFLRHLDGWDDCGWRRRRLLLGVVESMGVGADGIAIVFAGFWLAIAGVRSEPRA